MATPLSKTALIDAITKLQPHDTSKRQVRAILQTLVTVGHREIRKTGIFVIPGLAKLAVVRKKATPERSGINPFTGQPTVFKAKPARRIVKARPVKAAKDALG